MENATRALLMAAGVLIGVLILSLAVYLIVDFGSTSAQINSQNAENQLTQFNSKFTAYEGRTDLTIYDIITIAGYAKENNNYYVDSLDENGITITVKLKNGVTYSEFQNSVQGNYKKYINDENFYDNNKLLTFTCNVTAYHENGRVMTVVFTIPSNNG